MYLGNTTAGTIPIALSQAWEQGRVKEGDLVFFDFDGKKYSHVGIYLQNGYFFHASTSRGVMVGKLKDGYNYKYFSRAGSVK